MSFRATMRLHLSNKTETEMAAEGYTPEKQIQKFVAYFQSLDLSTHPTFVIDEVLFFEDISFGSFRGVAAAIFTKDYTTFIQTSTGEVLALSYNHAPKK